MRKIPLIISFTLLIASLGFGQDSLPKTAGKQNKKSQKTTHPDTSKIIQSDGTVRISTTHKGKVHHKSASTKRLTKRKLSTGNGESDSAR